MIEVRRLSRADACRGAGDPLSINTRPGQPLMPALSGGTVTQPGSAADTAGATVGLQAAREEETTVSILVRGADEQTRARSQRTLGSPASTDVETLLSRTDGWMVAHRGGSADWPEMSLRAYSESAARSVPALEFSFNLTADGIPVGVHNKDLQAVDPSAPSTRVSQMTWAEVRRYTTKGEPFIRLEDLQAAYGDDHVLFIDPKHSAAAYETYLPWLDPARTVLKFYGDATWLAEVWRASGFRTWGYLYEKDILNGEAARWAPCWDLVGVPWDMSEPAWEIASQYGPPLLGHICDSQQALSTCLSHGAVGAMCAKIDGVGAP